MSTTPTRITHLIGGTPWQGSAARTSPVFNPATGEQTGVLDLASSELVGEVVTSAKAAWESSWQRASLTQRTQVLFRFRELLNERKAEIAELITAEHGKVVSDAIGEVTRGLEVAEFACGIPHLLKGGFSENVSTKVVDYTIRQSLGVVAATSSLTWPTEASRFPPSPAAHRPLPLPWNRLPHLLPHRQIGRASCRERGLRIV